MAGVGAGWRCVRFLRSGPPPVRTDCAHRARARGMPPGVPYLLLRRKPRPRRHPPHCQTRRSLHRQGRSAPGRPSLRNPRTGAAPARRRKTQQKTQRMPPACAQVRPGPVPKAAAASSSLRGIIALSPAPVSRLLRPGESCNWQQATPSTPSTLPPSSAKRPSQSLSMRTRPTVLALRAGASFLEPTLRRI